MVVKIAYKTLIIPDFNRSKIILDSPIYHIIKTTVEKITGLEPCHIKKICNLPDLSILEDALRM